jgi:hypothetical protein
VRRATTVRAPDASFVRAEVLGGEVPIGFLRCAPDLAVEVLSPDDRPGELAERMADYVAAGTRCIWVVDADARTVTVHRPGEPPLVVHADVDAATSLDGAPVLPGFALPLAPLFAGLARARLSRAVPGSGSAANRLAPRRVARPWPPHSPTSPASPPHTPRRCSSRSWPRRSG